MILDAILAARRPPAPLSEGEEAELEARLAGAPKVRSLPERLLRAGPRPHVIAEFKRRSPSAGPLLPDGDAASVARSYAAAGASALSILTDERFFGGSLADLAAARAATEGAGLPVLRKDFVLFDAELVEARLAGADSVLLIARLFDLRRSGEVRSRSRLAALIARSRALGMEPLVEVHDGDECARAVDAGATLIGVNHRDLDTLAIDLELSARVADRLPPGVVRVAESGLRGAADLARMAALGYHGVLVGEALLREASPGDALRALTGRPEAR